MCPVVKFATPTDDTVCNPDVSILKISLTNPFATGASVCSITNVFVEPDSTVYVRVPIPNAVAKPQEEAI